MKKIIVLVFLVLGSFNISISQTWSPLGSGMSNQVTCLTVFNNELIAGGYFPTAGGASVNYIAKWNGTNWASIGGGMNATVSCLIVFNNELIAGGEFTTAGGVSAIHIAKWNGTSWSPLGSGLNIYDGVTAFTVFNNELIMGGLFQTVGGVNAKWLAKWNGTNWAPLSSSELNAQVASLTVFNNELIVGGPFTTAGGIIVNRIAKWNGTNWAPLGSGMSGVIIGAPSVGALIVYNNELFAGGNFFIAGGDSAKNIAKWNDTIWSPVGGGIGSNPYYFTIYNNELITGGTFTVAGGMNVNQIAKWNGTTWSQLGNGVGGTGISRQVNALTVFNNNLIVGGVFTIAGGDSAKHIAKWWTPYSISGFVKYSDNNQPATNGYVKAFKLDRSTGNIITYDSAQIQPNGSYTLTNVPQDSLDIGVYPNSTTNNDWVITYYPSTTYWQGATTLYPTGNLTNINIGAIRLTSSTNNNSVNGKVMRLTDAQIGNLKDAVLYAKNGNTFVRCGVSDENGVYHLPSLPAGNLKIICNRIGFTNDSAMVNVTSSGNIDSINFHLYRVPVGIKQISITVPTEYKLFQNYPNPFNPSTIIRFQIKDSRHGGSSTNSKLVILKVYDVLGKEVATLVNEKQSPGVYEVTFDGSRLASGMYFYRLTSGDYNATKRFVLIK